MQVDLRPREECWNAEAISAYAEGVNAKEARLAVNQDVSVSPGKIACWGCVENQWGNGTMCSAQLTETQFVVLGERPPRPEDAYGSMYKSVPGFEMVKPGSGRMAKGYIAPVETVVASTSETASVTTAKRGLRRLLSR